MIKFIYLIRKFVKNLYVNWREREGVIRLLLHGRSSYTKRSQWVHINGILLCGISLIYYYIYMYMNDLIVDDIIHKCMTR